MNVTKMWLVLYLTTCILVGGCNKGTQPASSSSAKHYPLKGKVVSIDKQGKMLNVDGEAIPGLMDAMTMPYQVKPESELDKLHPGDSITGDLTVQDDNSWLDNITVTGHSAEARENK